jgi:hypothetical protein
MVYMQCTTCTIDGGWIAARTFEEGIGLFAIEAIPELKCLALIALYTKRVRCIEHLLRRKTQWCQVLYAINVRCQ